MTDGDGGAPLLVLGPLLRYVGETDATIWVETDRPCQVEILGYHARTFEVTGHHYALVMLTGLRPGAGYEYQVALDGAVRWPEPDSPFPPSVLRTLDPDRPLRLVYGSCRIAELPVPQRRRRRARRQAEQEQEHAQAHGACALEACAHDLLETPHERWPDVMFFIGDQVYADETGLPDSFRLGQELVTSRAGALAGTSVARLAGVHRPAIRWRITRGTWFDNMLSALEFSGRTARISFERTVPGADGTRTLSRYAKRTSAEQVRPAASPQPGRRDRPA